MLRLIAIISAIFMLTASAFSQVTVDAQVPVTVNVGAFVSIVPSTGAVGTGVQGSASAGAQRNFDIKLTRSTTSVSRPEPARATAGASAVYRRGNVTLNLSSRQYPTAELSLYSVSGKRVLGGRASASNGAACVSRSNLPAGVYLLSVKGGAGNSFSARITHDGGAVNVNTVFGDAHDTRALGKAAAPGDYGTWTITVAAHGYGTVTRNIQPDAGLNGVQRFTLNALAETPPTLASGTASNPIIGADAPDPSIVRVGSAYYMVSTTMHFAPVAPVMKSYDLVNWRIVSYCTDILEDQPAFRLGAENDTRIGDYSQGQWAASLRHYRDSLWVMFANNTTGRTYLFNTANADTGPWTRTVFNRQFHDPSLFHDARNNKLYVIHGYNNITITELELDARRVKPASAGGIEKTILRGDDFTAALGNTNGTEGSHVYFRNGYYYLIMITWLNSMRTVVCVRTQDLVNGPYTIRNVLRSGIGTRGGGVAQGGIIETPDGDWYGLFFQDRDAVGRVPALVPMTWSSDNWPVFPTAVPQTMPLKLAQNYKQNVYASDEFNNSILSLTWQWNHNPDNSSWSLAERPGYMRLKTVGTAKTMFHARNTLTQRAYEPECEATVLLEPTNMRNGDRAGLMVLQSMAGFVGIEQEAGQKYIVMYTGDNESTANRGSKAAETRRERLSFTGDKIYLRASCKFRIPGRNTETAVFSYSLNGTNWTNIGTTVNLVYNYQTHFVGARFGLFNYATQASGGHVDFDYFQLGSN